MTARFLRFARTVKLAASMLAITVLPGTIAYAAPPAGALARPVAYRLDLTILPERARFDGHVEIDLDLDDATSSVVLDGQDLQVSRAVLRQGGTELPATYRETDADGHARLDFARPVSAGRATLVLDYDAAFADSLAGIYRTEVDGRWYAWSQLEARHARRLFPGFDRPGFKTPFTVSVTTSAGLVATSNGAEQVPEAAGALVRHRFATTAPLPTYLVAVAVGPFAVSSTSISPSATRKTLVPLRILAPQGAGSLDLALTQTGPILEKLEAYMGRPYPYPKLDQIASPLMSGGMENAAAIIYDQGVLVPANPRSPASQAEFVREVSHELSHQWFGDLVTPKGWGDLWLNESFANWMSYRIGDRWRPELQIGVQLTQEAIAALRLDELAASHSVHERVTEDAEPAFDDITYGKGGQVLGMLEAYLGEEKFRAGLQRHLARFADGNADTADFFASLADTVHDPRVLAALRSFVDQPGVPVIAFARTATGYRLSQSRYAPVGTTAAPQHWTIPVCYRADAAHRCLMLDGPDATIAVAGAGVLMPNAGGLGYYRFSLPERDWRALIATSASLSPAEALMMTDSLWAGFGAGDIAPDLLVMAARSMAGNSFGPAALDAGKRLAVLRHQGILPAGIKARYSRLLMALYRPLLDKVGFVPGAGTRPGDTPERQRMRIGLVQLLADEAEDPVVLAGLAQGTTDALAGKAGALAPELEITGYTAYLRAAPLTRVPALFERFATTADANQREIIAYALGTRRDHVWGAWLLDRLGDARLSYLDRQHVLFGLAEEPATRDAALAWAAAHLDLLSRQGVHPLVIGLADNACSATAARSWSDALGPRIGANANARLLLDATLEKIRNCASLREKWSEKVAAAIG